MVVTKLVVRTQHFPHSLPGVCGYQFGSPETFSRSIIMSSLTVGSQYLDGVSITHAW